MGIGNILKGKNLDTTSGAAKVTVIGNNSHPFYKWARKDYGIGAIPKWNFHKIIIGKDGKIVETFSSITKPTSKKFLKIIEELI